jgi:hypothetical protein
MGKAAHRCIPVSLLHRCILGAASLSPARPLSLSLLNCPLSLSPRHRRYSVPVLLQAGREEEKGRERGTFLDRR